MTDKPAVSIIIPAYRAYATLPAAVASIDACGLDQSDIEIVVASDDGDDYHGCLANRPNAVFTEPGPVASGPGSARNRALRMARGRSIAFLDADDAWEPGYLAALLPMSRSAGAAFAATSVRSNGEEILRLGSGEELTLDYFGKCGASFHPVAEREFIGEFAARRSQDTLHSIEILALMGGRAPAAEVGYILNLRESSTTRQTGFSVRVEEAYRHYQDQVLRGRSRVPGFMIAAAARALSERISLNSCYARNGGDLGFYAYLASQNAVQQRRTAA